MVFSCEAIVFSCVAMIFFSCERVSMRDGVGVAFDFFERFLGVVAIEKTKLVTVAGATNDVVGVIYTVVTSSRGG